MKKKPEPKPIVPAHIQEMPITETLEQNYMPYAISVIVSRAIPEIDGFKPSHRKLLYTMYLMGLLRGDRTKSSNVVGQTMRLNPHGDAAIYETMVRLTTGNGALLLPFVDSKGNFGKVYSRLMAYAAPRYTEVKLAPVCQELFGDIDKNTVTFVDNFDGTMQEPLLLPVSFPNILVNPNQGIAVGMASNFCSFNLREVCDTTIRYIKNPDCDLLESLPGPDLPTGGELLYQEAELRQIYDTGRGSFRVRAKYHYDKKSSCIEVTEIPYSTTLEAIQDKIIQLVKAGKIKDVTDVRDETDLNGLKLTLDIRRSADPELLMRRLFALTPLEDTFSCNFNLLIDGRPKTLGVREILGEWLRFRLASVKNRLAYDIEKKTQKLHLLQGLSQILLDIDKAIRIIRETELESMVVPNLMLGFTIDQVQAEYIAEIKLRNINREFILNRIKEREGLEAELRELQATLGSDAKIKNLIAQQLRAVAKKYGEERRTAIVTPEEGPLPAPAELIEDYGVRLFLTEQNYLKKISLTALRTSGEQKLKEDDQVCQELDTTNRAEVLLFSDRCCVYKLKAHEIPDGKASQLGLYLPNLLGLSEGERILYVTATKDFAGYMFFVFQNGKAVKVPLGAYATKSNRKKLVNAYSDKAPLAYLAHIPEDSDFLLLRDADKATLMNTALLSESVSKNAGGIQAYTLKKNSKVSRVIPKDEFLSNNVEYYRTQKLPTTGHFLQEADKQKNGISPQIVLPGMEK